MHAVVIRSNDEVGLKDDAGLMDEASLMDRASLMDEASFSFLRQGIFFSSSVAPSFLSLSM